MKKVNSIELIRESEPGGAIYQVADDVDRGQYLFGLGLWDRANEPLTIDVKNKTPGQLRIFRLS